jgi:twinkle protein
MISEKHLRGIEARSLSRETAVRMGVYSASLSYDSSNRKREFTPDPEGKVLCFPMFERGEEVNTKYRWQEKDPETGEWVRKFEQRKGAARTVYGADIILNEETLKELEAGTYNLIWVEGEFDRWAADECGFPHTISLADGSMPGRTSKGVLIEVPADAKDIDPDNDVDKFAFMARLREYIMRVKTHIIATDNDDSGRRMAKEIVRRLGAAKCRWVVWPTDQVVPDEDGVLRTCKDLNEVKQYLGDDAVRHMLENSKDWPVRHLYRLSDYPDLELPPMCEPGITPELDRMMKIYPGQFIVGTGVPNIGKSRFFNQLFVHMAKFHKWPIAMFSGESDVKPFLAQDLKTIYLGKLPSSWTREDNLRATAFIERYFSFIDYDPQTAEGQIDVDTLLDMAATSVFKYGTKLLAVDPFNELEHVRDFRMSLTEYVGQAIRKMKRFGKSFECSVCVVAHPAKSLDTTKTPSLYHISDSAHFANKADLGVVLDITGEDREAGTESNFRDIHVVKVRHKRIAGMTGTTKVTFDEKTGLFVPSRSMVPF